jgi:hypothetical protein
LIVRRKNVEYLGYDLFKTIIIFKEIEESKGRRQIDFSQELEEEVHIAK